MDEVDFIWMDGKFVSWKDAKVHVLSHTLHYGMGVFEGIRFYETDNGPAVFRLKDHIKRLFDGAETIFMKVPFSKEKIESVVLETIKLNKVNSGYIRPLFYYGYGKMGLSPEGAPVNCSVAVWPWGNYLEEEAKVNVSSFRRIHPQTTHTNTKICGHYVNSIFASIEARNAGFDEALLLDYKGNIAEGPGENFFVVKDEKLITPPLQNILSGITRDSVITIANDLGLETEEKDLKLDDLAKVDEAFFTGTAAEISPISSINDITYKQVPGEITNKLKDTYESIVNGSNNKYINWLSFVK